MQVLTDHTDEVWHVAFSHDGTMLASASKDQTAIIWQVQRQEQRLAKKFTLRGHSQSIAYLAWSPDDTMLATCGNDNVLRVWSSSTGDCIQEMSHHSKEVSSVAWLPDSKYTSVSIYIMLALADVGAWLMTLTARGLHYVQHLLLCMQLIKHSLSCSAQHACTPDH